MFLPLKLCKLVLVNNTKGEPFCSKVGELTYGSTSQLLGRVLQALIVTKASQ